MHPSGTLAVLLALLAAVPWSFALSGPDAALVAFALAPPLLMALVLGFRVGAADPDHPTSNGRQA